MKRSTIIFSVLILFYYSAIARSGGKLHETIIKVKLIDENLNKAKVPMIKLQVSDYPFGGIEFFKSVDISYEQIALKEETVFNISSSSEVFYMYIYYEGQKIPGGLYYWIDNIYIIKAGSELTIELDNRNINFSGKGSTIPNIQSQIIKNSYELSESDLKLLNDNQYLQYFQKIDRSLDSALNLQLSVIESNKTILGDHYVKLLTANCYGYRYYSQLRGYDFELMQNEEYFKVFQKYYNDKMKIRILPKFTDEILDASPIFANYIIEELNVLERIGHDKYGPMLPDSCIKNILQKINSNYSGHFKDKLATLFAFRTEKNENALSFFDDILSSVKTERYNSILLKKIGVKRNNVPFKDFCLEDENGKFYTLDDFKNKVVLLDFWFTGCENCVILNEAMKPIIKYFSNNPHIQFVSISIDKNKKQWLKSIKLGDYTHDESINLYTNGEGSAYNLIRSYNITSYPTVFIIKDGLMFSSLPPRPSKAFQSGLDTSEDGLRLIKLLEKAIKLQSM